MGLYSNAYRRAFYPIIQIHAPLTSVAVSALSRRRADPDSFSDGCRRVLLAYFSVVVPALAFMFIESRNVILVLLGSQWIAAIPIFQILCIAGLARALDSVTKWVYLSTGRTDRQFRWSLLYMPATVIAVIVGVKWGAYGVAVALAVTAVLLALPSVAYCIAGSPLRFRDFVSAAARPLFASAAAAVLLILFDGGGSASAFPVELILQCVTFGGTFLVVWLLLPGGRKRFGEMLAMLAMLPWPQRHRRGMSGAEAAPASLTIGGDGDLSDLGEPDPDINTE